MGGGLVVEGAGETTLGTVNLAGTGRRFALGAEGASVPVLETGEAAVAVAVTVAWVGTGRAGTTELVEVVVETVAEVGIAAGAGTFE